MQYTTKLTLYIHYIRIKTHFLRIEQFIEINPILFLQYISAVKAVAAEVAAYCTINSKYDGSLIKSITLYSRLLNFAKKSPPLLFSYQINSIFAATFEVKKKTDKTYSNTLVTT